MSTPGVFEVVYKYRVFPSFCYSYHLALEFMAFLLFCAGFTMSGAGPSYNDLRGNDLQLLLDLHIFHLCSVWAQTNCTGHEPPKAQHMFGQRAGCCASGLVCVSTSRNTWRVFKTGHY